MTHPLVLIPTRNRARLAENAVASALSQGARVFVSDNSTHAAESARLSVYCESLRDERLTYVRPPEPLPMSEHWDWAMSQALQRYRESHIAVLTDRMVFRSNALCRLSAVASHFPDKVISYMHDRLDDNIWPIRSFRHPWSGKLYKALSERLLRSSADVTLTDVLPRALNCLIPRTTLEGLRARFGNYFSSFAPDFYLCFRTLASVDSILFLDEALLIHYALNRSNGASAARGEMTADRADFIAASGAETYPYSLIPGITSVHNAVVHEYRVTARETGCSRFPEVDREKYLAALAKELPLIVNAEVRAETERLLRAHGWTPEPAPPLQPLWRRALSPRTVTAKIAREARARLPRRLAPDEFETVEEALAYALKHRGEKIEDCQWKELLGLVEITTGTDTGRVPCPRRT